MFRKTCFAANALTSFSLLLLLGSLATHGQQPERPEKSDKEAISKAAQQLRESMGIRPKLQVDAGLQAIKRAAMKAAFQQARLQQNAPNRLVLALDTTLSFHLIRTQVASPPPLAETQSQQLRKQLRDAAIGNAHRAIHEVEIYCRLTEAQRNKLLLAATTDVRLVEREISRWCEKYSDADATNQVTRQAVLEVRNLNALTAQQIGDRSLVRRVFLGILTEEQQRQLRAAYMVRFSDLAFAIGVPVEQRPRLLEVLNAYAADLPLTIDPQEFRIQVMNATSTEELARVVGEDYAIILKQTERLGD